MLPVQISFHGVHPSPALSDAIEARAAKLAQLCPRALSCRVAVEAAPHHGVTVHLRLTLPGDELVASHDSANDQGGDAYSALTHAFVALRRRLRDEHARRSDHAHRP